MAVRRKVLHVLEALEGGTARHVVDLVSTVPEYEPHVAVTPERFGCMTDDTAIAAMRTAGAQVHLIAMRRRPAHPDNARAFLAIRRLVAYLRPDIVHTHASIGGALGRAAAAAAPGRPRTVWTPNGLMTSRPVVLAERALDLLTDWTIAVSESEAVLMRELRLVPSDRVSVIPNGISLTPPTDPPPDIRRLLSLGPDVPLVGTVGRLVPQKAPLDFVAACKLIAASRPDVHFVYVGGGELERDFNAALASWPHGGRFHHLDYLRDAGRALGALDVFLLMSRYEGAPYAPMEAMREGVPIVATDVVGTRDVVTADGTGLLVTAGDARAAADAVLRVLGSEELRGSLVRQGAERVRREFDVAIMGQRVGSVYDDLVAGVRGRGDR